MYCLRLYIFSEAKAPKTTLLSCFANRFSFWGKQIRGLASKFIAFALRVSSVAFHFERQDASRR